jgi:hypothetical protein
MGELIIPHSMVETHPVHEHNPISSAGSFVIDAGAIDGRVARRDGDVSCHNANIRNNDVAVSRLKEVLGFYY